MTRSGEMSAEVTPSSPCITSAGRPVQLEYGSDFEQVFVRVNATALCPTCSEAQGDVLKLNEVSARI
ncbi:hypothetical protein [Bradyrhizobium sp.]